MTDKDILSQLQYEDVIRDAVERKLRKDQGVIQNIARTAYDGQELTFPLCRRKPLTRLAVVTHLLGKAYQEYHAVGVPNEVIWDTFRDVSLRAALYHKRTGRVGLAEEDVIWFRHIMNVKIFKLGVMQFQPFEMLYLDEASIGEDYMSFIPSKKEQLPNGSPVLNCHIQRHAMICPDAVENSMETAKTFFKRYFPLVGYQAFLCYSWMLYPPMVEKLPNHSNIKQFAARFDIIGSCADSEQAVENLFETGKRNLPLQLTSLQRLALEHKECLGFGCGIRWLESC